MLEKEECSRDNSKLSQTREEVQYSSQSAFTLVILQGNCCPRVLFEKDNQTQNSRQGLGRFLLQNRGNQSRQSKQYPIARWECPGQGIRDHVEIDAHIAHRFQKEQQAKGQCQSFHTDRQKNHSVLAPHRQTRKHSSSGKVRPTRYSGHNQEEKKFRVPLNGENKQLERDILRKHNIFCKE